jgi:hypothetical protein
MAISWKLPCQISAHSPLLEEKNNIKGIAIGKNKIILINSIKGKSYKKIDIITYSPKHIKEIIEIKIV